METREATMASVEEQRDSTDMMVIRTRSGLLNRKCNYGPDGRWTVSNWDVVAKRIVLIEMVATKNGVEVEVVGAGG